MSRVTGTRSVRACALVLYRLPCWLLSLSLRRRRRFSFFLRNDHDEQEEEDEVRPAAAAGYFCFDAFHVKRVCAPASIVAGASS